MTDQPDLDFTPMSEKIEKIISGNNEVCTTCGKAERMHFGEMRWCSLLATDGNKFISASRPQAHARRTDRPTSIAAAASVRNISETQEQILRILRALGPQTDEEIQSAFVGYCSPSGLRSRRAELVRLGKVRQNAREGRTAANRACAVWEIVK